MSKNELEYHINKCLQLIESKLAWGNSSDWTNYDFTKLSDDVHSRTHVRLSVTTLKRIWGKVKYENAPTLTTLNTLAQFAGYVDWRDFCRQTGSSENAEELLAELNESQQTKLTKRFNRYWFLIAIPFISLACFLILSAKKPIKLNPDVFQFKADKIVTEGVPNSVVFHYDASAAATDSVFIVQTWDVSRKKLVSKSNHEHSSIYYYPGFFRTKLIVGNEIVKTHDLWITSDGWLGLVAQDPVPLYFKKEEYLFEDRVEINEETLSRYNLSLHPSPPIVRIFNQRDLGDMMSDNFVFETSLKNEFKEGTGACQFVQVLIQCKDDVVAIPLAAKTCVGDMELYFCGKYVESKDTDLSGFGCDLNQWTKLRVESVNKKVNIYVNGTKVYSLTFPNEATGVVGVQYRFNGVGAVKDTWFKNRDEVIRM